MSGNLLLFLLFFVGLVATTTSLMRAQRQSRELEAQRAKAIQAKVSQMRQETEEDVTTFGEALRDLDMEMVGKDISLTVARTGIWPLIAMTAPRH